MPSITHTHAYTPSAPYTHSNVAKERLSIILAHQRLADVDIQQLQVRPPWPAHHHRHKEGRGMEGMWKEGLNHSNVTTKNRLMS